MVSAGVVLGGIADAETLLTADDIDIDELTSVDGQLMSAFVRAAKPLPK